MNDRSRVSAGSRMEPEFEELQAFRRLIVRHEFYSSLNHGFAKLACLILAFRRWRLCDAL